MTFGLTIGPGKAAPTSDSRISKADTAAQGSKKRATDEVALFAVNSERKNLPAVTTATAAAIAAAATVTEVVAFRHRLGFIDGQRAPVQLCAVQGLDGFLGLAARAHLDEAETSRLPGELVGDHI